MAGPNDAEIAAIERQLESENDSMKRRELLNRREAALRGEVMSAEGDMYAGTNNDAAMRRGESARSALSGMKTAQAQAPQATSTPSDFPIGFINEIREMMRRETGDMKLNPSMSEMVAWWEPRKDKMNLQPSQQKFKDPKEYTIPAGVQRM